MLPATHPGEEVLVCHAIETGVSIDTTRGGVETEVVRVTLESGHCVMVREQTSRTRYAVRSVETESQELLVDHQSTLHDPQLDAVLVRAADETRIAPLDGCAHPARYVVVLAPGETVTLRVEERVRVERRVALTLDTFAQAMRAMREPFPESPALERAIELAATLDERNEEARELQRQAKLAKEEQDRVKALLAADPQNGDWKKDLRRTEDEIREITRTRAPALQREIRELRAEVTNLLAEMSCRWAARE